VRRRHSRQEGGRPTAVEAEERIRLLSMVDVFETLPREELAALAGLCQLYEYRIGERVFGPETGSESVYVLEKGRMRLYRAGPRGRDTILAVLGSGTVFGRLGPTVRNQKMHAQAAEHSLVSALRQEDLERLVMRRPEVGLRLASLADERLSLSEERTADLVHKEVPGRLASLLLRLLEHEGVVTPRGHEITTRYTHQQLGAMIGANREAVTRAFGLLRRVGAVEVHHRRVRVPEIDALERAATTEWRRGPAVNGRR